MWRLWVYPLVFVLIWLLCKYPDKVFNAVDKFDAKLKELAWKILR